MSEFETFSSEFLNKLGYKFTPFYGDYETKFVQLIDDSFRFMDIEANNSYREKEEINGDILVKKDEEGLHCCPSTSNEGTPILYHTNYQLDWEYYILWENDKYTKLPYLYSFHLDYDDTFEYITTEYYLAIKFHKHGINELKRLEEKPFFDTLISRSKKICYVGAFTYFYKDKIVVYGKNEVNNDDDNEECEEEIKVTVYDEKLNVLFEGYGGFKIWEWDSKVYLIFPCSAKVYDLTEGKEIKLFKEDNVYLDSIMIYKDILVLYTEHHYPIKNYYDDGDYYLEYDNEDTPIRNTNGYVYNSEFELIRKFNVLGQIIGLTDFGDQKVMRVDDSDYKSNTIKYFNVNGENITRYNDKTDEEFSVPDISFTSLDGYESLHLSIVKTKMYSPDVIAFGNHVNRSIVNKCGVYIGTWDGKMYEKIVDCKYDYIKSLPLKDDENVYYLGVTGSGYDNKYDLYVNHKLMFYNYPFKRGHSICVLENKMLIKFEDTEGRIGYIRNGEIVFNPKYKHVRVICHLAESREISVLECLYIVSENGLFGVCSSNGELILPIEYSVVDIDDCFNVVLGKKIPSDAVSDENEKSVRFDTIMYVGNYSSKDNTITYKKATIKDGVVFLDEDGEYIWDGGFVNKGADDNESDYYSKDHYSHGEAMYDALGSEMDAIWNID